MSICSLDPPDLSRNSTADVALEHWGRRGPRGRYYLSGSHRGDVACWSRPCRPGSRCARSGPICRAPG